MHSPRIHGGAKQLGTERTVLDFSVNINYYGPSSEMQQAIKNCDYSQYPDPYYTSTKEKIGLKFNLDRDHIHLGSGAAEIFWTIISSFSLEQVCIVEPTFSEFKIAALASEKKLSQVFASAADSFSFPEKALEAQLIRTPKGLCYICSPNSPTGTYVSPDIIKFLANKFPDTIFVLDHAFIHMSRHSEEAFLTMPANVIKVFSLTKDHGIPGIRIGYAIASKEIVNQLNNNCPTWNISAPAAQAAEQACDEDDFVNESYQKILIDKSWLQKSLKALNYLVHSKACPFLLVKVKDGDEAQNKLLEKNVLVRSCASYGLKEWIRVFPRELIDNQKLIDILRKVDL